MLILILINVQYLQKVFFSFEKDLNGQNHFSSGSRQPIKKLPAAKFRILPPTGGDSPHPLTLFGNPVFIC